MTGEPTPAPETPYGDPLVPTAAVVPGVGETWAPPVVPGVGETWAPPVVRHTWVDDIAGVASGSAMASLGLILLKAGGVVTGGTAGVVLLVGQVSGWPFWVLYTLVNVPFIVLAALRKGLDFAVRSIIAVAAVAGLVAVGAAALTVSHVAVPYAALLGNLCAGVGILILFRHGSSLGGFNVVALLAQERLGWRAGYVQLVLDAVVVLCGLLVLPVRIVLWSALGAALLDLVLALNHRPGRYLGA